MASPELHALRHTDHALAQDGPLPFPEVGLESVDADVSLESIADRVAALLLSRDAYTELIAAIDEDLETLTQHQLSVERELQSLVVVALPAALHDCNQLMDVATNLNVTFARVDRLHEMLDTVHHLVLRLHEALRIISEAPQTAATTPKDRAAGFLKRLGWGSDNSGSSAGAASATAIPNVSSRAQAVWARVPAHVNVDGTPPSGLLLRVREVLRRLQVQPKTACVETPAMDCQQHDAT